MIQLPSHKHGMHRSPAISAAVAAYRAHPERHLRGTLKAICIDHGVSAPAVCNRIKADKEKAGK